MSDKAPFIPEVSLNDLQEIVGDDPEVLKDVIDSFLQDAPKLLKSIQEGTKAKDVKLVERSAHTLKSSSRLFQAENFAVQCQELEELARNADWETIAVEMSQLGQNFRLVAQLLVAELNKL